MEKRTWKKIIVFVLCLLLNLVGKYIAETLQLPLWFDMTGTCVAAYFLGLPVSVIVAALNNLLYGLINGSSQIYVLTAIACAVLFWLVARKEYLDRFPSTVLAGFWLGAVSIFVSTPINLLVNDGYSTNLWGDAFVDMLLWHGANKYVAAFGGELVVDIIDKQVCLVAGYLVIRLIKRYAHLQGRYTKQTPEKESADKWQIAGDTSKRMMAVIMAVLLTAGIFAAGWGTGPAAFAAAEQDPEQDVNADNYSSTIYDNLNGLMSSEANTVAGTDDGYIWIGSYAGLTRYDGTTFEFLSDEHTAGVRTLFCDSKGRLWIGTNDDGVSRYEDGVYTRFTVTDGLASNSIRCFYETTEGGMIVATADKICYIDPKDEITTLAADVTYVTSMTVYDDMLICVSKDGVIYAVKGDEILATSAQTDDGQVYTCVKAAGKGLYAGTTGENVYRLAIDDSGISVKKKLTVPVQNIKRIIENDAGNLWVCGDGIGYIDSGDQYHAVTVDGFESSMEDIYQDYQGNIWVASSSCGVMKLAHNLFDNLFTDADIAEAVCNATVSYDGLLYCGTDSGLAAINEETGKSVANELTKRLAGDRIRDLYVDTENRLWLCTYGADGLVCMDADGTIHTYTEETDAKVTSDRIRCITQVGEDAFAVGTADGLFFVENGQVTANITKNDGLDNSQILALYQDADGTIFAGSDGGGVYVIEDHAIRTSITTADGLSSDVIMHFVPYQDSVFLITSNSLCVMENKTDDLTGTVRVLSNFPYYNNYDILIQNETAYVLSSAGIYALSADDLMNGDELIYSLYSAKSGLMSGITANAWNFITEDGVLYVCCNDGVVTFDSRGVQEEDTYCYGLDRVICDGTEMVVTSDVCEIPKNADQITLQASLRNYSLTDVKVKVYVSGYEEGNGLISASEIEDIHLSKLTAGEYIVHFQIYNTSGSKLLDEKVYTLVKKPQMWEQPWYRVYLVFVAAESVSLLIWSLVWVLDYQRKRTQLERFAKKLEEKVEEQRMKLVEEGRDKDKMLMNTVVALSGTVDAKDRYTSGHSARVARYSKMLAARMGKTEEEQENIYCAGLLHDVGKIRVPEAIINKPGKLTADEYEMIKLHPITGYHILKRISPNSIFADGAKFHHERYDGKGYPNGLAGTEIPEIARIIGVADAYDAMASNRSYRSAMVQAEIRAEIENGKGTQFDPDIADIMLKLIDEDMDYEMREAVYSKKQVLVIDKENSDVEHVKKALSEEKIYDVMGVPGYEDAVAQLRKDTYDVILLDVSSMEDHVYAAVQGIHEISNAPVIFMMEGRMVVEIEKGREIGVDDFITKPFMPAALKEIVHAVLSQ